MDLETIGYFLYMEEQEQKQEDIEFNVNEKSNLFGAETTTNE